MRKTTYKKAVQRLLDLGFDLEDLMLHMLSVEKDLTSGYKERHWYAVRDADGSPRLSVVQDTVNLSFRVQDLARYRSLLKPNSIKT